MIIKIIDMLYAPNLNRATKTNYARVWKKKKIPSNIFNLVCKLMWKLENNLKKNSM